MMNMHTLLHVHDKSFLRNIAIEGNLQFSTLHAEIY